MSEHAATGPATSRRLFFVALLGATAAFADPGSAMQTVTIRQSTVGHLGDVRIGVMRVSRDEEYTLADGTTKTGLGARISIFDGPTLTVGAGSAFTFRERTYEIVDVADEKPRGKVTIRRMR